MHPSASSHSPVLGELEDYLHEIRGRDVESRDTDDVYTQLAQKEKDLLLAAEIGKELLERNSDLSRQNERLTEEYSRKLEVLEQEKHALRRKLESLTGESDGKVGDLQADLAQTRSQLEDNQALLRSLDKERARQIQELREQNSRLTNELKSAHRAEEQARQQYQALRQQLTLRRSNLDDHVSQLEGLKEEITMLTDRKADLERRITSLMDDRENLSLSLEESGDRILLLEQQRLDYELQIRQQQRSMEELRLQNEQLQERLDNVMRHRSSSPIPNSGYAQTSLYNEIEMFSSSSADDELRSLNGSQGRRSRQHSQPGSSSLGFAGDDDEIDNDSEFTSEDEKMRQELAHILQELQRLCCEVRRHHAVASMAVDTADSGVPASPAEINPRDVTPALLSSVLADLRALFQDLLTESGMCQACQTVIQEREETERLRRELGEKTEEARRRGEELAEAHRLLSIRDTEAGALREERDHLRGDMGSSTMGKDEIVKMAWDARDQAVARKNTVEIELAKTRIELMHISSQLMEAIQQKVELSQQLEQWQVDMQSLLDERVRKQLRNQEREDRRRKTNVTSRSQQNGANTGGKLFGLWKRQQVST
ncbi:bicaudal D-related protein homolog [Ornithodoros turicata]|uniref:bicaudal D-related protein homolog n=1 Tax=Ornithodoros turicata TaxID=34597 RepID=UPI00313A17DE